MNPDLPPNEEFTGIIDDPLLDPRVINGWSIDEVLPQAAVLDWKVKDMSQVVQYPIWNQASTGACVAFAKAKQISIKIFEMTGVWIDFSPASIYQLRTDNTKPGMHIANANDIANNIGVTLEALMKSQNLTEAQINAVKRTKVADMFAKAIAEAVVRYLYVPVDIDRIAQVIESKKAVSLLIFATRDEYARMTPVVLNPNLTYENAPIRHEVIGVDYFLDANGVKKIFINDSSHFGGIPVRELTESFLLKRCRLADAIDLFTFEPGVDPDVPHFVFTRDLQLAPTFTVDQDVIALQNILKYEALFPSNQASTGWYGPLTQKSVGQFQLKYGLAMATSAGFGRTGPVTRAKLNELYGQ